MATYRVRLILLGKLDDLREIEDRMADSALRDLGSAVEDKDFSGKWGRVYEEDVLIPFANPFPV